MVVTLSSPHTRQGNPKGLKKTLNSRGQYGRPVLYNSSRGNIITHRAKLSHANEHTLGMHKPQPHQSRVRLNEQLLPHRHLSHCLTGASVAASLAPQ